MSHGSAILIYRMSQSRNLRPEVGAGESCTPQGVRVVGPAVIAHLSLIDHLRMQIPRPSEADKERFRSLVPEDHRIEVKPMFGNLGAFVNGNMFMGLYGSDIGVKLSSADQQSVRAAGGGPFGPAERPMSGYVALPQATTPDEAAKWVESALSYVADLPPKQPKRRKP
jgi:TfoX/Sxy family transcriptional regulator of competence genes